MRRRKWTREEIEILESHYGLWSFEAIGKNINRSAEAVRRKAYRLQLGKATRYTGNLTARDLGHALGVCPKTIVRWIKNEGLKGKFSVVENKRKVWRIDINNFWEWAEEHQHLFNATRMEENILGVEPNWFKEKRKKDYPLRNEGKVFTKDEDEFILANYKTMNYIYIGKLLGRTKASVKHRIRKLKLKNKLVILPWTDEEINIVLDLRAKGLSINKIAIELGRSYASVMWKERELRKENCG